MAEQWQVRFHKLRDLAIAAALVLIGVTVGWIFWDQIALHEARYQDGRLAGLALGSLNETGVSNPVTAVLLDFRAYDTLLELAVLFAALLGIWSTGPAVEGFGRAGIVLRSLTASLVPMLVLTAGYMLWVGAYAPGGAFQAGALLGAAGVILRLSGQAHAGLPSLPWLRVLVATGVSVFTLMGLVLMAVGAGFLDFPVALGKWLILLIETAATLAIGATLAAAYLAGEPSVGRATPRGNG